MQRNPSAAALLDRAEWLTGKKFLHPAYEDACAALKRAPKSLRARYWKGGLAWELGRTNEVGDVSKVSLETLMDEDSNKRLKDADASTDPEERAHALLACRQAMMALAEVGGIDGSIAKVSVLVDLEQLPKAEAAARRALELHPDDAEAWFAMARLELGNGNIKETLECLNKVEKLTPGDEDALELRKEALERLGRK